MYNRQKTDFSLKFKIQLLKAVNKNIYRAQKSVKTFALINFKLLVIVKNGDQNQNSFLNFIYLIEYLQKKRF